MVYEISNEDTLQLLQNQCILSDVESETVVENTSSKNSEVDETEQIFESDYQIELLNNSNVMVDESGLENSDSRCVVSEVITFKKKLSYFIITVENINTLFLTMESCIFK